MGPFLRTRDRSLLERCVQCGELGAAGAAFLAAAVAGVPGAPPGPPGFMVPLSLSYWSPRSLPCPRLLGSLCP